MDKELKKVSAHLSILLYFFYTKLNFSSYSICMKLPQNNKTRIKNNIKERKYINNCNYTA